jgi:glycosyltransferase involved in cell wall biosynthesis
MRVGLLSANARAQDAVGNHVAETAALFLERGASVRVFVQSTERLHPELCSCTQRVDAIEPRGAVWDYLVDADLVIFQYTQATELLHFLPLLAGGKPRLLLDYHSVTPPELWSGPNREALQQGLAKRGLIWCVDAAIAHSAFTRQELVAATGFPADRIHRLPLVVDHERFRPGAERFLHRRLGLGDVAILLYVGRLAANKRVPLLVEALGLMPGNVHAVIVGDSGEQYAAEAQHCRQRARALGVADRLHLVGQLGDAELAAVYRSADVLVIPSRHEGFCVPVMEAMASGLPVVASRSAALPETVGDAGLTFAPDDAADLARQIRRVLPAPQINLPATPVPRRIAIVCFRFGAEIVGGAEASLRTIAQTLHGAGHRVEVFATCTRSESEWRNELPAGTTREGGLGVHRFPIDRHDRDAHVESVRAIVEAQGTVPPEAEERYLRHSIHSAALVQALRTRAREFDAIIVGPYLFGLTHDVARAFPERTLLMPCFHDEPLARLAAWPSAYGRVGGILLHSPEEKELMLTRLGINAANVVEIGTLLQGGVATEPRALASGDCGQLADARGSLVYCGRYSAQKNLPLLLDWMSRYQKERPGRMRLVCLGRGEVPLPREPWLQDIGYVDEARKRTILAGARALVQLSLQESLSLVALEAWAQATPVIVHAGCAVLAGQVRRSGGGAAVADYEGFARALDELIEQPGVAAERGRRGLAYVAAHYASRTEFVGRLEQAIVNLDVPLRELMRRRGLERAACCDRPAWREALGSVIEDLLDAGARPYQPGIVVEPLNEEIQAGPDARTTFIAARIHNRGTHAAVADGPGRTLLQAEVRDPRSRALIARTDTELPGLLVPGATQTAMLLVPVPPQAGSYDALFGAGGCEPTRVRLHVGQQGGGSALAPLLDGIRRLLIRARAGQRLPADYVDVTLGRFARWKRWLKAKLLYNFKRAYVDVLSYQQSEVNEQLVAAVQQLAECCATLDHAVRSLQRQLDEQQGTLSEPRPSGSGARLPAP